MKILVVGCGSIGRRHLANLLSLGTGEVAACDASQDTLAQVEQAFRIPTFVQFEEALEFGPEVVFVCTPTHLHIPIALAAVRAGSHVFVEKPLAASMAGVKELESQVLSSGRIVMVGCNMRFHPGVACIKQAIDSGLLKAPLLFRSHFSHYLPNWRPDSDYRRTYSASKSQGGGMIMEGVHEIDYLRWYCGEVRTVQAYGGRFSHLGIDSEDVALLFLEFENGALGEIHLDYLRPLKSRGCEVVGSDGMIRWVSEGKAPETIRVDHYDTARGTWKDLYRNDTYDSNLMYVEELKHFLECVSGNSQPLLDVRAGRRVLELALMARNSLEHATH